jgi:ABC-type proline/glycine betaine transport system permease subunit/glycine betaine/choline ABC-type transport system substrate-binding protein
MNANFRAALALLPDYLGAHLLLSVSAILLGTALGLPLAVVSARRKGWRTALLGFSSIVQTIPALALLALFYPLLLALSLATQKVLGVGVSALGWFPALLALTLYAMLPVLRNTVTALTGIEPAVLIAAKAVGMTPRQSLLMVELPLAAPVIVAGIRTASVWVVGTATLSTPVGQTSLGNYIFTGLQTENWVFVLFGCVSAALLALLLDALLALAASGLARPSRPRLLLASVGLVAIVLASLAPLYSAPKGAIIVGAKNFTEQYVLAELIADRLKGAGISTALKSDLGSAVAFHALAADAIDVYVDYSGTLWANEMHRHDTPGRQAMLQQLGAWLDKNDHVELVGPLGFENAYVLAMRTDRARTLHIKTLADLGVQSGNLRMGGDFEIFSRPEWKTVVKTYGLAFAAQLQYQPDFLYRAVADGSVDVISAFSSDSRIARYGLTILDDTRSALPPYDAVLLLAPRHAASLRPLLKPLVGSISLAVMQHANLMVDRDHKTAADAAAWLTQSMPSTRRP